MGSPILHFISFIGAPAPQENQGIPWNTAGSRKIFIYACLSINFVVHYQKNKKKGVEGCFTFLAGKNRIGTNCLRFPAAALLYLSAGKCETSRTLPPSKPFAAVLTCGILVLSGGRNSLSCGLSGFLSILL